jgi:hypothetical protein
MIGRFPFYPFRSPWPNQRKHQPLSKPVDTSSKLAAETMGSMSEILQVDALKVGVGAASIYSIYQLSRLGLKVQCTDIASDVGETWY